MELQANNSEEEYEGIVSSFLSTTSSLSPTSTFISSTTPFVSMNSNESTSSTASICTASTASTLSNSFTTNTNTATAAHKSATTKTLMERIKAQDPTLYDLIILIPQSTLNYNPTQNSIDNEEYKTLGSSISRSKVLRKLTVFVPSEAMLSSSLSSSSSASSSFAATASSSTISRIVIKERLKNLFSGLSNNRSIETLILLNCNWIGEDVYKDLRAFLRYGIQLRCLFVGNNDHHHNRITSDGACATNASGASNSSRNLSDSTKSRNIGRMKKARASSSNKSSIKTGRSQEAATKESDGKNARQQQLQQQQEGGGGDAQLTRKQMYSLISPLILRKTATINTTSPYCSSSRAPLYYSCHPQPQLHTLNLQCNYINDETIEVLSTIFMKNPQLTPKHLIVNNNKIGMRGRAMLGRLLRHSSCGMECIDLSENNSSSSDRSSNYSKISDEEGEGSGLGLIPSHIQVKDDATSSELDSEICDIVLGSATSNNDERKQQQKPKSTQSIRSFPSSSSFLGSSSREKIVDKKIVDISIDMKMMEESSSSNSKAGKIKHHSGTARLKKSSRISVKVRSFFPRN